MSRPKKLGVKVKEPKVEEPKVEEPKVEEPKVEEKPSLGKLGGKEILSIVKNKKVIGGKQYHEVVCIDSTTYLLNDHDVEEQIKK